METASKKFFITHDIMKSAILGAFKKFNPVYMIKNPVMFVVEIGFIFVLLLTVFPTMFDSEAGGEERLYNAIVAFVLFITILFANFAESIAEGRGKAQVQTLKKTKTVTQACVLLPDGSEVMKQAEELTKGDIVLVQAGEVIPNDGEVIEGIATVDESAITGESAPVVKERGGDFSSVTGGTTVTSDWLKIEITSLPGESFLDKMITLIEGASRKKTPNEIALNTLLVSLTIIFLLVVVTLYPMTTYLNLHISIATLIA
ncbi:HAD-IC family P-type ATPase, partial [Psychrobacillus psychrotolerans]